MDAVFDSSSLISLARAGLLHLVPRLPVEPVLLDTVWEEVVRAGRAGGHADALALESTLGTAPRRRATAALSVDAGVLAGAAEAGVLIANDLALGRRARNLGVAWLRTADLLLLAVAGGRLPAADGRDAVIALRDSRRITLGLAAEYLEELDQ